VASDNILIMILAFRRCRWT